MGIEIGSGITFGGGITLTSGAGAAAPTTIGQVYGGGYYAGKVSTSGNGVATHYLVVAPKATGEVFGKTWNSGAVSNTTSLIDGPGNTATLAASGSQAALFCTGLAIGGFTDWYLPSFSELQVLYFFLKPSSSSTSNSTVDGSNPYSVLPYPPNTVFTNDRYGALLPTQTTATVFQGTNAEAFNQSYHYLSSSESSDHTKAITQRFPDGMSGWNLKTSVGFYTRAIRRVPV